MASLAHGKWRERKREKGRERGGEKREDTISREREDVGESCGVAQKEAVLPSPDRGHDAHEPVPSVPPPHGLEHVVVARLEGDVKVLRDLGQREGEKRGQKGKEKLGRADEGKLGVKVAGGGRCWRTPQVGGGPGSAPWAALRKCG